MVYVIRQALIVCGHRTQTRIKKVIYTVQNESI